MENVQDDVIEIARAARTGIKVYDGIGFVNDKGVANYLVSLDPDPNNTYKFNIFKIRNDGFLIHLDNSSKVPLTNASHNIYQIDFDPKTIVPTPKEYKVVVYHENRAISKKEAKQKFDEINLKEPDATGKGIIRP